jgi:cytidylate kinase
MTASVLTFSNQTGAGGGAIARAVADKLQFRYYDWEVIAQAAQEAGVSPEVLAVATSERLPGFLERMMSRLAAIGVGDETSPVGTITRSSLNSEDYRQFLDHVVRELGNQGEAVIVNNAGQVILRDKPGVLKILVRGSETVRAARLAEMQNIETKKALQTVTNADRQRSEYFRRIYHLDWLSSENYDIVLNSDIISTELAIDMIGAAAREMP